MAKVDEEPEERFKEPLKFNQIATCPFCGQDNEAFFVAEGVYDIEYLTEAPETDVECVGCDTTFHVTYEGWLAHEDAG